MKIITYAVNGKTRTRGFKDSDLHSLVNNKQITIISASDDLDIVPGYGLSRLMTWVRVKCGG